MSSNMRSCDALARPTGATQRTRPGPRRRRAGHNHGLRRRTAGWVLHEEQRALDGGKQKTSRANADTAKLVCTSVE